MSIPTNDETRLNRQQIDIYGYGYRAPTSANILPERPSTVAPVFDAIKCAEPLQPFSDPIYQGCFGIPTDLDGEDAIPLRPESFGEPYLSPTLTRNESARLAALWYYSTGIQEDEQLLKKLDRIMNLVKQSFTWELGIIGLLDYNTYTRLVTVNLPLAILPRHECTCAHTVNLKFGTVLSLTDMSNDWRFQRSPHVEFGGLQSYAAAQIRLVQPGRCDVVFGTLCVASVDVQAPLTDLQKRTLVSAADLVAGELVAHKQARRLQDKQDMHATLQKLRSITERANFEEMVIQNLAHHYHDTNVSLVEFDQGAYCIGASKSILPEVIKHGLWEDLDILASPEILAAESVRRSLKSPVRAIVAQTSPDRQILVVSSTNVKHIFDDTDIWFVGQCAQIIRDVHQVRIVEEALAARDKLLRSITHDLRTPIHGILSSVELLDEELKFNAPLSGQAEIKSPIQKGSLALQPFLRIIRQSATQLMTTVNSILRLNSITDSLSTPVSAEYDLRSLEGDVLGEVFANYADDQLQALSVNFDLSPSCDTTVVTIDADLLKELVKCLVFNSISAVGSGTIEVLSSFSSDQSLLSIDVTDTGRGIDGLDHHRIFQAFEKLDVNSPGVGLGLGLARQMATKLNGRVWLVSSCVGRGSHFRIELPCPGVVPRLQPLPRGYSWKCHPSAVSYYVASRAPRDCHLTAHLERFLSTRDMTSSDVAQGSLIICTRADVQTGILDDCLSSLAEPHLILHVSSAIESEGREESLVGKNSQHLGICLLGPFYNARLKNMLDDAWQAFERHRTEIYARRQNGEVAPNQNLKSASQEPLANSTPPATPCLEKTNPISRPLPRPLRALLVDDNTVNLAVLKAFCKKRKLPHVAATDGNKAVSAFRKVALQPSIEDHFELVLMDLQMPECDGVEAVRQIRDIEKQNNLQPCVILMITGQDSAADKTNSFEAGADAFFVKPVSVRTLDQAIAEYFSGRQDLKGRALK